MFRPPTSPASRRAHGLPPPQTQSSNSRCASGHGTGQQTCASPAAAGRPRAPLRGDHQRLERGRRREGRACRGGPVTTRDHARRLARLRLQTRQLLLGHVRDVPVAPAQVQRVQLRHEKVGVRQSPGVRRGRQRDGELRQERVPRAIAIAMVLVFVSVSRASSRRLGCPPLAQVLLPRDELEEHGVVVRVAFLLKALVIRRIPHVHGRRERNLLRGRDALARGFIEARVPSEHRGGALQLPRAVAELHEAEVLLDGRRSGRARQPRRASRERASRRRGLPAPRRRSLFHPPQPSLLRPRHLRLLVARLLLLGPPVLVVDDRGRRGGARVVAPAAGWWRRPPWRAPPRERDRGAHLRVTTMHSWQNSAVSSSALIVINRVRAPP